MIIAEPRELGSSREKAGLRQVAPTPTILPKAVPLRPLIEPCVQFSCTRLSDVLHPCAFADVYHLTVPPNRYNPSCLYRMVSEFCSQFRPRR